MKIYKLTFKGGHKVSLVKDPAIEETLLKFSKEEEEKLYFANDEKRVVYSVAMIPNKLIFRKNINGEPAQVFYDEQAIEDFQQQYFRNQDLSTNINHSQFNTDGVFPFESWIVANSEVDKSKELGLNAPNGSLVMGFKIENDTIWNDVKEGKLDGLSIEGFTKIEEVTTKTNTNKNEKMSKETKLEKVTNFFKELFADETPAKTPEEIAAEAAKEAEATPQETAEETLQKQVDELTAENEALKAELSTLKAEQVKAETEMTTMKSEKETMATEIEKLKGEIVEVKMVKNVPATENLADIPYEKMTNKQKLKFNREN